MIDNVRTSGRAFPKYPTNAVTAMAINDSLSSKSHNKMALKQDLTVHVSNSTAIGNHTDTVMREVKLVPFLFLILHDIKHGYL